MTVMNATEPTRRLAAWAATLPRRRTREVQSYAIDGVRDLLACMIAGTIEPPAQRAAQAALAWGTGGTSMAGHAQRLSAPASAFANGTAAHVLDYDDSFAPLTGHPSAPVVPAVLALAEETGAAGEALLDAYVVGIEIIAAIGRVANPSHYAIGWHSTATIGGIGAAVACARLLGLDAEKTAAAISIAVSTASGSRLQLGSPMKSVHAGLAAQHGVIAARLAAAGITGNSEPLTGERGFLALFSQANAIAFPLPEEGEALAIASPGLTFKPYPTCGSTHRSLDALLFLKSKHGFAARDVHSVDLDIPALNVRNLRYDRPRTGLEAKFSMPYCAALALVQNELSLYDFEDISLCRAEIVDLMPKITMRATPGSDATDKDYLELPAFTTVVLKDGSILEDERYDRRGSMASPLSAAEHDRKFRDCAGRALAPAVTEHLLGLIDGLGTMNDVRSLMDAVRGGAHGAF